MYQWRKTLDIAKELHERVVAHCTHRYFNIPCECTDINKPKCAVYDEFIADARLQMTYEMKKTGALE
jgi:hypothetical protein